MTAADPTGHAEDLPDDAVEAAVTAAARSQYEMFRAAQMAVGVQPMAYAAAVEDHNDIDELRSAISEALLTIQMWAEGSYQRGQTDADNAHT